MLFSAPLIIRPYEIMQLQTSIRSCEGNHYVVTVINDAAQNSAALLKQSPAAQGAFEGRGPVAKETDDIQNGPSFSQQSNTFFCLLSLLFSYSFCFSTSCCSTFFFFLVGLFFYVVLRFWISMEQSSDLDMSRGSYMYFLWNDFLFGKDGLLIVWCVCSCRQFVDRATFKVCSFNNPQLTPRCQKKSSRLLSQRVYSTALHMHLA